MRHGMTQGMRRWAAVLGIGLLALAAQPALAGGWGHYRGGYGGYGGHHGGYGRGWVPFAVGAAVLGGVAVGTMLQPQPVYAQPAYAPPVRYQPRVVYAPPAYVVPPPPPAYYGYGY